MSSKLLYFSIMIVFIISLPVSGETTGNRIIDKEEIEASGITQLSEIFTLIPEWPASTIDGITWNVSPNGLEPYSFQRWKIILDNVLLDFNLWGTKPLDMIPINISQIDYIEVINIPGIYAGEFIESGALHFHTIENNKNTALKFEGNLANETGDPGPYRYTEYTSPNVDRLAENIGVVFDKEFNNASFSINFKNSVHFPTDPAVRQRNTIAIDGDFPKQNLYSAGFKNNIGKLKLTGGMSSFDDFNDMVTPDRSQELISLYNKKKYRYINLEVPIRLNKNLMLKINGGISKEDLIGSDFAPKQRQRKVSMSVNFSKHKLTSYIFIEHKLIDRLLRVYNKIYKISSICVENKYQFSNEISNSLIFNIDTYNPKSNMDFTNSFIYNINNQNKFYLNTSYFRKMFDVPIYHPYNFFINDVFYEHATQNYLILNSGWQNSTIKNLSISINVIQKRIYDDNFLPLRNSDVLAFAFRINYKLSTKLKSSLNYLNSHHKAHIYSSDASKLDRPDHVLQLSISYEPYRTLSLWGKIKYSSSTFWIDENITLDEMLIADLTIRKKLMKNRAAISLGIRNILNDTQRYHPAGAAFDLNYFVRFYIDVI